MHVIHIIYLAGVHCLVIIFTYHTLIIKIDFLSFFFSICHLDLLQGTKMNVEEVKKLIQSCLVTEKRCMPLRVLMSKFSFFPMHII